MEVGRFLQQSWVRITISQKILKITKIVHHQMKMAKVTNMIREVIAVMNNFLTVLKIRMTFLK